MFVCVCVCLFVVCYIVCTYCYAYLGLLYNTRNCVVCVLLIPVFKIIRFGRRVLSLYNHMIAYVRMCNNRIVCRLG